MVSFSTHWCSFCKLWIKQGVTVQCVLSSMVNLNGLFLYFNSVIYFRSRWGISSLCLFPSIWQWKAAPSTSRWRAHEHRIRTRDQSYSLFHSPFPQLFIPIFVYYKWAAISFNEKYLSSSLGLALMYRVVTPFLVLFASTIPPCLVSVLSKHCVLEKDLMTLSFPVWGTNCIPAYYWNKKYQMGFIIELNRSIYIYICI